jgi:hypothetical protein
MEALVGASVSFLQGDHCHFDKSAAFVLSPSVKEAPFTLDFAAALVGCYTQSLTKQKTLSVRLFRARLANLVLEALPR